MSFSSKSKKIAYDTPVMIVGAGPTGLMMAGQLARFGIDCVIIDKKSAPDTRSKAIGVQARTLEIYDQMGIVEPMLRNGNCMQYVQMYLRNRLAVDIRFGDFGKGLSPYPYVLILSQQVTDTELAKYVTSHKRKILWNHELVKITQNKHCVTTTIKDVHGKVKKIRSRWAIGADGAHSFVRHHIPVEFEGGTYKPLFWLADVKMTWDEAPDTFIAKFSQKSFLIFFPMSNNTYRLTGSVIDDAIDPETDELTLDQIRTLFKKFDIDATVHSKTWTSVFKLHHRHANNFRHKRIFLTGDAAHIHSPVGAQGMNTGLQDAYNLAWKMAYIEKGFAHEKILNTYNQERLPFARSLIKTTDRSFAVISSPKLPQKLFRRYLLPMGVSFIKRYDFFKRMFFKKMSQISIRYSQSDLTKVHAHSSRVHAGERFPYVKVRGKGTSSFDWFKHEKFTLIVGKEEYARNKISFDELKAMFKDILEIQVFNYDPKNILLVRPDMHVGCVTRDRQDIVNYLMDLSH